MSNNKKIQITTAENYNPSNLVFLEPVQDKKYTTNQRINIKIRGSNGTQSDLVIPTEYLFSFGVQEKMVPGSTTVTGHTFPLCLYSRDGPTEAEKKWVQVFRQIEEQCKKHILDNRVRLGKKGLDISDLKKFSSSSLYWKLDDNEQLDPKGPTLYPTLIVYKNNGVDTIKSDFYDMESFKPLDAMTLLNKKCNAKAAIKIEGIFIGSKISLQVKLWEVGVEVQDTGMQRLLAPSYPTASYPVACETSAIPVEVQMGSIENSSESDSESESESTPVLRPTTRGVNKRVTK